MDIANLLINNFGAQAIEVVNDVLNGSLVSRNKLGGKNNGVPRLNLKLLVVVKGHPVEGALRFSLAARGEQQNLGIRISRKFVQVDFFLRVEVKISKFSRDTHIDEHGSAVEEHLPVELSRQPDNLLNAVQMAGKHRSGGTR